MIKQFAKLQVSDFGEVKCSKCSKVLVRATVDYFRKNDDASDVWLTQLADDHFQQGCTALMAAAKAKLDIVQDHSPDATFDDVYQCLI